MSVAAEKYRVLVTDRAEQRCEYCHYPQRASNTSLEIEHIIPRSKGGKTIPQNLALACRRCNSHKSNRTDGIDNVTHEHARIFNPRSEDWDLHFHLNHHTGAIEGRTAIGRVTARELSMNEPMAVMNRQLLIELGLFSLQHE